MNRRLWLRWSALFVTALVASFLFAYLINCGPKTAQQARPVVAKVAERPVQHAPEGEGTVLRMGWTAWADAEVVTSLAAKLVEQGLGIRVDRIMADIGIQYQAVANGDLDVMLMAWLPLTHRDYWEKVQTKVIDLGPIYVGRLGWAVPDYVPKTDVTSVADLKKTSVATKIGFRVQGIDPGAGLMQASERAIKAYGLNRINLVSASGAAMTAVLARSIQQHRWIVVTAWQPHWIFARYRLRFLSDPKGIFGGVEGIHAVARSGFQSAFPAALTKFFSRFYIPDDELAAVLLDTQTMPVDAAVERYIRTHPKRVKYWLTGSIKE